MGSNHENAGVPLVKRQTCNAASCPPYTMRQCKNLDLASGAKHELCIQSDAVLPSCHDTLFLLV